MSMYPDEQVVVIDGEEVSYPGLKEGKFSSGDFTDPSNKPSFIPAETINLILDNLSVLIAAAGGVPINSGINQLAGILDSAATVRKIVQRDAAGRAQIAAPSAAADIANKGYVDAQDSTHAGQQTAHGAVSAPTALKMVVRDAAGRAQFANPSAPADAATKDYVMDWAMPVNAVYIQFPGQSDPTTLWPGTTWSNISSSYPGAFFRAEGGAAQAFASQAAAQAGQNKSHNHGGVSGGMSANNPHSHSFPNEVLTNVSGSQGASGTSRLTISSTNPTDIAHTHTISADGGTENRPENYTIRVWKRTA